jgi:hypothetical protein
MFLFLISCSNAVPTDYDSSEIDPSLEPIQEQTENEPPITFEKKGWTFTITPKANYKISGEVISVKKYYYGFNALLSPVDIALVFGDLYTSGLYKEIKWSQSGRWYWWKYGSSFPKQDDKYIARWSSNNHIIPATENVKKAAKSVSKGDLITLEGYLIFIDGKKEDQSFWWRSSLSRSDTGDGSCEVIYLKKIRIGENVYE